MQKFFLVLTSLPSWRGFAIRANFCSVAIRAFTNPEYNKVWDSYINYGEVSRLRRAMLSKAPSNAE